jgi:hypothetical protein
MPSIIERERQLQKVIDRWENEGGAIATSGREGPRGTDDRTALERRRELGGPFSKATHRGGCL